MNTELRVKEYNFDSARRAPSPKPSNNEDEGSRYEDFWHKLTVFSFFAIIMGLLVLRIILPTPTISEAENRELKTLPSLSAQTVFLGSFTKDYEDYFADTFPFRDSLIEAGDYVSYLYNIPIRGVDTVIVADTNVMQGDDEFDEGFDEGFDEVIPDTGDFGNAVPTPLEALPTPLVTTSPEPSGTPEGADSHVVGADAGTAEASGRYVMTDTAIYYQVTLNPDVYTKWANGVNALAQTLPSGTRLAVMTPPNSYAFYAPEEYYDPDCDQEQGIQAVYGLLDSSIYKVNPYPYLYDHMDEYIYFRTDHHWTARGAYCGYTAFCDTMKLLPQPLSGMERFIYEKDFLGSYYKELKDTAKAKLIRNVPDYIEYFVPPAQCQLTMYTHTSLTSGRDIPMFDLELPSGTTNYYRIFLGGDYPCIKIETDTHNGQSILILKDSYANAFAPFLTANYETIYIVDFRDFNSKDKPSFDVTKFVTDNSVNDVLLLLNFNFVNSSTYVNWYLRSL